MTQNFKHLDATNLIQSITRIISNLLGASAPNTFEKISLAFHVGLLNQKHILY